MGRPTSFKFRARLRADARNVDTKRDRRARAVRMPLLGWFPAQPDSATGPGLQAGGLERALTRKTSQDLGDIFAV